jgi:hypothetical protein
MRNRLYLVLGILLVAAVVGLLWWSPWEARQVPEPVYDGKPISYWLSTTGMMWFSGDIGVGTVVPPEFLVNGSNSVPFFTKALKRDSWIGAAVYRKQVWPKLPPSIKSHLPPPGGNVYARQNAVLLLGLMGPMAKPAIPSLIRALREDEDRGVRNNAAWALGQPGKGDKSAIAALTAALNDKDAYVRRMATNALRQPDPEAAAKAGVKPSPP